MPLSSLVVSSCLLGLLRPSVPTFVCSYPCSFLLRPSYSSSRMLCDKLPLPLPPPRSPLLSPHTQAWCAGSSKNLVLPTSLWSVEEQLDLGCSTTAACCRGTKKPEPTAVGSCPSTYFYPFLQCSSMVPAGSCWCIVSRLSQQPIGDKSLRKLTFPV